jgi:hypothetical protein
MKKEGKGWDCLGLNEIRGVVEKRADMVSIPSDDSDKRISAQRTSFNSGSATKREPSLTDIPG